MSSDADVHVLQGTLCISLNTKPSLHRRLLLAMKKQSKNHFNISAASTARTQPITAETAEQLIALKDPTCRSEEGQQNHLKDVHGAQTEL